jgi:MFS family permease
MLVLDMTTTELSQRTNGPAPYPQRWPAAIVMITAALMDLIDGTIVNVALPTIRRDYHASGPALEWVVSAYLLALAATPITAGRVGDLIGRRRMFLAGVATFGLASLACGLSRSPGELIAARAVAGGQGDGDIHAVVGSVFFARVGSAGFTAGFELAMPLAIGAFAACAALSLVLPETAVGEAYE